MEVFGVPTQALFGQLLIGLINGSFYALLSLGLAVIFGLFVAFTLGLAVLTAIAFALQKLDIVNFTVTGITLVCSHLVLVLWEAARAYPAKQVTADDAVRS